NAAVTARITKRKTFFIFINASFPNISLCQRLRPDVLEAFYRIVALVATPYGHFFLGNTKSTFGIPQVQSLLLKFQKPLSLRSDPNLGTFFRNFSKGWNFTQRRTTVVDYPRYEWTFSGCFDRQREDDSLPAGNLFCSGMV
ncbi:MAG: hypothetical protein WC047_07190, partial [Kiritimatiellales bacterium]